MAFSLRKEDCSHERCIQAREFGENLTLQSGFILWSVANFRTTCVLRQAKPAEKQKINVDPIRYYYTYKLQVMKCTKYGN